MSISSSTSVSSRLPAVMQEKLSSVRWRQAGVALLRSMALATAVLLILMLVAMSVDWSFTITSTAVRSVLTLVTVAAAVLVWLWTGLIPVLKAFRWTSAAGQVDLEIPQLEERWTTVASFAAGQECPSSPTAVAMLQQVTSEAVAMGRLVRPQRVIRTASLKPAALIFALSAAAFCVFLMLNRDQTSVLVRRFLSPLTPITATQLLSETKDRLVPRGQSVEIVTRQSGLPRTTAVLTVETQYGPEEIEIEADTADPSAFVCRLDVDDTFRYRVTSGDGQTDWHTITAIDFPELSDVSLKIVPPSYVDQPVIHKSLIPGRLRALQGSELQLELRSDSELKSLNLLLTTGSDEAEVSTVLTMQRDRDGFYRYRQQLIENISFSARLLNIHDLENEDRRTCHIDVIEDSAPVARIISPTEEMAVSATDVVDVKYEAHDDYGIAKAELVIYDENNKDENGQPKVLMTKEIPLDQPLARHVTGIAKLDLKELKLEEGASISYAVRVTDNRDVKLDPALAQMSRSESGEQQKVGSEERSKSGEPQVAMAESENADGRDGSEQHRTSEGESEEDRSGTDKRSGAPSDSGKADADGKDGREESKLAANDSRLGDQPGTNRNPEKGAQDAGEMLADARDRQAAEMQEQMLKSDESPTDGDNSNRKKASRNKDGNPDGKTSPPGNNSQSKEDSEKDAPENPGDKPNSKGSGTDDSKNAIAAAEHPSETSEKGDPSRNTGAMRKDDQTDAAATADSRKNANDARNDRQGASENNGPDGRPRISIASEEELKDIAERRAAEVARAEQRAQQATKGAEGDPRENTDPANDRAMVNNSDPNFRQQNSDDERPKPDADAKGDGRADQNRLDRNSGSKSDDPNDTAVAGKDGNQNSDSKPNSADGKRDDQEREPQSMAEGKNENAPKDRPQDSNIAANRGDKPSDRPRNKNRQGGNQKNGNQQNNNPRSMNSNSNVANQNRNSNPNTSTNPNNSRQRPTDPKAVVMMDAEKSDRDRDQSRDDRDRKDVDQKNDSRMPPSPVAVMLKGQRSDQNRQQQNMKRPRLKVSERLAAVAEKSNDRKSGGGEYREQVVKLETMLAAVEQKLDNLLKGINQELSHADQFRALDTDLGDAEQLIADLRDATRDTAYVFVGQQMMVIKRAHITPARDSVFAAIKEPDAAAESFATDALHHVMTAREQLQELLARYDRVQQDRELKEKADDAFTMYEVYVEKSQRLMRAAQRGTDRDPFDRERLILELDQDYLDRFAEVAEMRRAIMDEFAKLLSDDPRLLTKYMEMIKRRRSSLWTRLQELKDRQDQIAQEVSGWVRVDETQRENLWTLFAELRLYNAAELVKEAVELAERMEAQFPLVLKADQGVAALAIQNAQQAAKAARQCSLDAKAVLKAAGDPQETQDLIPHAEALVFQLGELSAAVDRLEFEATGQEGVAEYVTLRQAEIRQLADHADAWSESAAAIQAHRFHRMAHVDQQQTTIVTELLRVDLLDVETDLQPSFGAAESSLPAAVADLARELQTVMEGITFNQQSAAFLLKQDQMESAAKQQELALEKFEQAEELFKKLRRETAQALDALPVRPPNIADLRDPTLDAFLAQLEREPNIESQLGLPGRPRNLRVIQESLLWQQRSSLNGMGMSNNANGSGQSGSNGASQAAMQRIQKEMQGGQNGNSKKPDEREQTEEEKQQQQAQAETMQRMMQEAAKRAQQEADDPNTSEERRQQLRQQADNLNRMLEQIQNGQIPPDAWDQLAEAEQTRAIMDALAKGEHLPDQQWNHLMSTLDDGLWQTNRRTPPEDYRQAIERYLDSIRQIAPSK
ncbi:MAG: hypothetical protein R3C49_19020 [Planctomycetaceae bacterium]